MKNLLKEKLSCIPGIYEEKPVIFLKFDYNEEVLSKIKQLSGRKWSRSLGCWYVPDNKHFREILEIPQRQIESHRKSSPQ